jgi:putative heme-binding domain-containing protein
MNIEDVMIEGEASPRMDVVKHNLYLWVFLFVWALSMIARGEGWPPLDAKVTQSIEALKRLKHMDIRSNAALNTALLKTLEKVKGRPEFVQLAIAFGLNDQDDSLLAFVKAHPDTSEGLMALDFLVKSRPPEILAQMLHGEEVVTVVATLGELPHSNASMLLLNLATDASQSLDHRKAAIRALCRTRPGVASLMDYESDQGLPQDLKLPAAYAFNQLPWEDLKGKALELIPLPAVKGDAVLPGIEVLTRQEADVENGQAVFLRPESGCAMCHQIGDQGVDFGPGLSEIGDKLGKDALFQSILDPNGGISFGFEGWELVMKSGEEWTGIIIGETEQLVTLKNQSGLLLTLEKEGIESRSQMKSSLMPSGLQQAMTVKDLVDLVGYLSSLRKSK